MSSSDIELMDNYRQIDIYDLKNLTRMAKLILIIASIILFIKIFELSFAIYIYQKEYGMVTEKIDEVELLINQTMTVLYDWEDAYHQVQPYLGQVCELFNSC